MNLVILGMPACGKGTISNYITEKYGFTHIAMGDLLRSAVANNHRHAKYIAGCIKRGAIVDEYISSDILKDYLKENNIHGKIILDGYPRGIISVHLLETFLNVDAVIKLDITEEAVRQRIENRLQCVDCGKSFNKLHYTSEFCDVCHGELKQRVDDTMETLTQRIKVYKESTMPVLDYYENEGKVFTVNADCSIEQCKERIDKVLVSIKDKINKKKQNCNLSK